MTTPVSSAPTNPTLLGFNEKALYLIDPEYLPTGAPLAFSVLRVALIAKIDEEKKTIGLCIPSPNSLGEFIRELRIEEGNGTLADFWNLQELPKRFPITEKPNVFDITLEQALQFLPRKVSSEDVESCGMWMHFWVQEDFYMVLAAIEGEEEVKGKSPSKPGVTPEVTPEVILPQLKSSISPKNAYELLIQKVDGIDICRSNKGLTEVDVYSRSPADLNIAESRFYLVHLRKKNPEKAIKSPKIKFNRVVSHSGQVFGTWKTTGSATRTSETVDGRYNFFGSEQTYIFSSPEVTPPEVTPTKSWYMMEFTLSLLEGQEWLRQEWEWAICFFKYKATKKRKLNDTSDKKAGKHRAAKTAISGGGSAPSSSFPPSNLDGFSIEKQKGITTPLMAKKIDRQAGVIGNGAPTRVLLLQNYVLPENMDDGIKDEVALWCAKYGTVTRVLIFMITEPNFPVEEAVMIFVQFERLEDARKALDGLHDNYLDPAGTSFGDYFGARKLHVSFYDEEKFGKNELASVPGEIRGLWTSGEEK